MKTYSLVAIGLLDATNSLSLPKAKPIKNAVSLNEEHHGGDHQQDTEKRNWYAGNSAFNNGMGTFFKRSGIPMDAMYDSMVTPEYLDEYLGEYYDAIASDYLNDKQKRNWGAGNAAYNNGMASFFKRHDPNFEHSEHEEDGALPKLEAKRNWGAGNAAYNNGMASFFKKRSNWGAGNSAYNNGMASFFKKRSNWGAGNSAYNNGMASFFKRSGDHETHEDMAKRNWGAGNAAYNNGMASFFKKRSNWGAGNSAYNNGMASFFKRSGDHENHAEDGALPDDMAKRNWGAGNAAYNNGMASFFKKRSNWGAGNSAYNNGMSSFF